MPRYIGNAPEIKEPIDLLSSGASIRKSDGTTAVLSESGGAVTLENASLGDTVLMPDNSNNVSTAPGIRFEADTATGIGLASAGNLAVVTGGSERLRINSSGNLLVGGNEIDSNGHTFRNTAGNAGLNIYRASSSTTAEIFNGYSNVGGTENKRFSVYTDGDIASGTGAAPTTYSSDIRTKENVIDASGKLSDLLRLRVVNFNFIGSENKFIGFIAHEFEEVFPSLVTKHDTRKYDDNGNLISGFEDTKRVRVGMEFAIFTKAIQEQQALIESQQSQIDALETRIQALEV